MAEKIKSIEQGNVISHMDRIDELVEAERGLIQLEAGKVISDFSKIASLLGMSMDDLDLKCFNFATGEFDDSDEEEMRKEFEIIIDKIMKHRGITRHATIELLVDTYQAFVVYKDYKNGQRKLSECYRVSERYGQCLKIELVTYGIKGSVSS